MFILFSFLSFDRHSAYCRSSRWCRESTMARPNPQKFEFLDVEIPVDPTIWLVDSLPRSTYNFDSVFGIFRKRQTGKTTDLNTSVYQAASNAWIWVFPLPNWMLFSLQRTDWTPLHTDCIPRNIATTPYQVIEERADLQDNLEKVAIDRHPILSTILRSSKKVWCWRPSPFRYCSLRDHSCSRRKPLFPQDESSFAIQPSFSRHYCHLAAIQLPCIAGCPL